MLVKYNVKKVEFNGAKVSAISAQDCIYLLIDKMIDDNNKMAQTAKIADVKVPDNYKVITGNNGYNLYQICNHNLATDYHVFNYALQDKAICLDFISNIKTDIKNGHHYDYFYNELVNNGPLEPVTND